MKRAHPLATDDQLVASPGVAAYRDGVTVICELAARFTAAQWAAPTPCHDWRAADIAGHLRCMADDYHEFLDDAPDSRLARLMATGFPAATLARKLERQNAAELAELPDVPRPRAHRRVRRIGPVLRGPGAAAVGPSAPLATGAPSSPSARWPAWPVPNGTSTPGTWPGRSAWITVPPTRSSCSKAGGKERRRCARPRRRPCWSRRRWRATCGRRCCACSGGSRLDGLSAFTCVA